MSDIVFKTAWRHDDAGQREETKAFWARLNQIAPQLIDQRASELGVLAYADDRLVGVATAELAILPGLRARFAVAQVVVDPEFRRRTISAQTFARFFTVLEAWSADHPDEKVMGLAAVIEAHEYAQKQKEPVWFDWGLNLTLLGYTPRNQQIRIAWFRHARID